MIAKRFTDITAEDIHALVANTACENISLEFKRDLPGGGDEAKREFLADVSALANTSGGDIVFGIDEEDGCASSIKGIDTTDTDTELLRLSSILSSGLDPRIRYSGKTVLCGDGTVLILRIEKSWNGPHRVVFKASDKFYGRTASGKYPLDVQQLRRAFVDNASVAERIRSFRADRLASIIGGATPLPMPATPKFVLHLIPLDVFFSEPQYDLRGDFPLDVLRPLAARSGWDTRLTFEGKMAFASDRDQNNCLSYLHFYRTGVIEMVDSTLLGRKLPGTEQLYIPGIGFERLMIEGLQKGLRLLGLVGGNGPVAAAVTLTNVKGTIIGLDTRQFELNQHPVLNEHLFLPETVIPELTDNVGPLIRPIADMVWNACGMTGSPHFDAEGTWKEPPRW